MRRTVLVAAAAALAATTTACGGDDGPCGNRDGDAKVICNWSESLAESNIPKAAGYFAIPAIVENGTPSLRLESQLAIQEFNASLPCGARLTGTRKVDRYTVAEFRLEPRPGATCDGVGDIASTAFYIEDGKIREWLRVPDDALRDRPDPEQIEPTPDPGDPDPELRPEDLPRGEGPLI